MLTINFTEYQILTRLDDKWKWVARDHDGSLNAFQSMPEEAWGVWRPWLYKEEEIKPLNAKRFIRIQRNSLTPYNITTLIEDFEKAYKEPGKEDDPSLDERPKNRQWLIEEILKSSQRTPDAEGFVTVEIDENVLVSLINQLEFPHKLSKKWLDDNSYPVRLLGTPDVETIAVPREDLEGIAVRPPKIDLEAVKNRMWEINPGNRKVWMEQLNKHFQEGYIVPLGLKTTDGKEQYLTYDGNYFASRRSNNLQQIFKTLEEIPVFYRELAKKVI